MPRAIVPRADSDAEDDWVVVPDDRSIERGWGVSLFASRDDGKENDRDAVDGRTTRLVRALVKRGLCKSSGEAKRMIMDGLVFVDGVRATRAEQRVASATSVEVDGTA